MEKKPDIRIFIACHKPTYVPENSIVLSGSGRSSV